MAILHPNAPDASFSTTGASAWATAHNFVDGAGATLNISTIADGTFIRRDGTSLTGAFVNTSAPSVRGVFSLADFQASVATTLCHPSLFFNVASGTYMFKFAIPWDTGVSGTGCKIGLLFPAMTACGVIVRGSGVNAPTSAVLSDFISNSGKLVTFTSQPTLIDNAIIIEGTIAFTTAGTLHVICAAEILSTASGVTFVAGASGIIWAF